MKKKGKRTQELLKDVKAGGRRSPLPRPTRFADKTKYNRQERKINYERTRCY